MMAIRKRNHAHERPRHAPRTRQAGKECSLALLATLIFGVLLLILLINVGSSHNVHHRSRSQVSPSGKAELSLSNFHIPQFGRDSSATAKTEDSPVLILDSFTPENTPVHTAEQETNRAVTAGDVCVPPPDGSLVRGKLRPDSILTMISVPKAPSVGTNSGGEVAERHIMFGWSQMKHVDFLIMSANCQVLRLAAEYGLPTVYMSSGSDSEDLTYRHILHVVRTVARTPFVGFTNGDIAFDDTLVHTLRAAQTWPEREGMPMTFIGRRSNVEVPPAMFAKPGAAVTSGRWKIMLKYMQTAGDLFIDAAQDYFIFSRDLPLNLDALVPFLLGGIAFDNYLATKFWELHNAGVSFHVDATETIHALHMNHGTNNALKLSHTNLASKFNGMLLKHLIISDKKARRRGDRRHKIGIHHGYTSHAQFVSKYSHEANSEGSVEFFVKSRGGFAAYQRAIRNPATASDSEGQSNGGAVVVEDDQTGSMGPTTSFANARRAIAAGRRRASPLFN
jgi:hypothetical protein